MSQFGQIVEAACGGAKIAALVSITCVTQPSGLMAVNGESLPK
jgi:hypothetical protein